jgi:peptidoglycan/LPS O-acetylase OafA/YrhL
MGHRRPPHYRAWWPPPLAPRPTSRPTEIRALTGALFLPVLFIVIFHYHEWYGYTGRYWIDLFVVKGYLRVEFFFSLSGFILSYVYGRRLAAG